MKKTQRDTNEGKIEERGQKLDPTKETTRDTNEW